MMPVFLLATFLYGFAACMFVCTSGNDDHCASAAEADHCIMHCICQTLSLPLVNWAPPVDVFDAGWHLANEQQLKLPLFAASIFNPPKA